MFSIITIESSTTKPVAMISAISERLSIEYSSLYITASVPISDTGTEMLGMIVAGTLRRKTKITSTTSTIANTSSKAASQTEERITPVLSATIVDMHRRRAGSPGAAAAAFDLVDGLDDVGARLALDVEHDRRRAVVPGALLDILRGLADGSHVAQTGPARRSGKL